MQGNRGVDQRVGYATVDVVQIARFLLNKPRLSSAAVLPYLLLASATEMPRGRRLRMLHVSCERDGDEWRDIGHAACFLCRGQPLDPRMSGSCGSHDRFEFMLKPLTGGSYRSSLRLKPLYA